MCEGGPAILDELGMAYAKDSTGAALSTSVAGYKGDGEKLHHLNETGSEYELYVKQFMTALQPHKDAGVTAIFGCTYFASARALIDAMHRLDYSPLAVSVTSALSDWRYEELVADGWFEGEYVMEAVVWHASDGFTRGDGGVRGRMHDVAAAAWSQF